MHKILKDLLNKGVIYQGDPSYDPDQFSFSAKEYREYAENIIDKVDVDAYKLENAMFPTYLIPIEEDGHKFVLRIMLGQGSAYDMFTEAECNKFYASLKNGIKW